MRTKGLPEKGTSTLPLDEAERRAAKITLLLTDTDGVLTDGGVYYGEDGEVLERFSARDDLGVERLRKAGIATGIMTRETSQRVHRRAEKLRIRHLHFGLEDKLEALGRAAEETGASLDQLAYIGDDYDDLGVLGEIAKLGLTAAPADAMPEVILAAHYRCRARGGHGAFRDFAEWILRLRGIGPIAN